jgi:hypothetical protein
VLTGLFGTAAGGVAMDTVGRRLRLSPMSAALTVAVTLTAAAWPLCLLAFRATSYRVRLPPPLARARTQSRFILPASWFAQARPGTRVWLPSLPGAVLCAASRERASVYSLNTHRDPASLSGPAWCGD